MKRGIDIGGVLAVALIAAFWIGAIGGWIANIVKLAGVVNDPLTGMVIFRAIGIVCLPLGAILGWV